MAMCPGNFTSCGAGTAGVGAEDWDGAGCAVALGTIRNKMLANTVAVSNLTVVARTLEADRVALRKAKSLQRTMRESHRPLGHSQFTVPRIILWGQSGHGGRGSSISERISENRHDRSVFTELAGIDFVERIGSAMMIIKVVAGVLSRLEAWYTFAHE